MDVSPFCSFNTKDIPFPGLAGHSITICQLGWAKKRDAKRAAFKDVASMMAEFEQLAKLAEAASTQQAAAAAAVKASKKAGDAPEETPVEEPDDPMAGYDVLSVLKFGVKGWTVERGNRPVPVNDESLNDLRDDAKDEIARAIVEFSGQEEAERKND